MNMAMQLIKAARSYGDRPALTIGTRVHATYAELARRAAAIARALRDDHRLALGDRVAIAMTNEVAFYEALFAIWCAGLVAVPVNARLHAREFAYILDNSGARLCFVSADLAETIAPLAGEVPALAAVVSTDSADYARMNAGDGAAPADAAPEAPAWLFYTSGTTGRPKGATLTHRNLLMMTLSYFADIDWLDSGDTIVHAAPLSHGSGLYGLPHIARAANNVVPESGHFDAEELTHLIAVHPNVSFFAAPTMLARLVNSTAAASADFAHLKAVIYGGGPMYVADLERALELLGPRIVQVYGQGESPMTITALSKAHHADTSHPRHAERLASTGIARTDVEVAVVGEDDAPLGPDDIGEVVVRGDVVMAGYWGNAEATRETLRAGWLHTGDLGALDEDGFLTLKDRSKDLIISGGTNIYPREIEEVLLRHEGVLEASVVGRPSAEWGEDVVAFVVTRPRQPVAEADLDRLCLEHIARFKRPKAYRFVDSLPKNNYGKVLKTELRARLMPPDSHR